MGANAVNTVRGTRKKVLTIAEYIERGALMQFPIRRNHYDRKNGNEHFINGIESVLEYAENLPAADVAPVRHGRWLQKKHKIFGNAYDYVCSECGCDYALAEYNYCPNCGAKMDGGVENG